MPEATGRRWPLKRSTTIVLACLLLILWTAAAGQWADKKCPLAPASYFLVLSHGTPGHGEGCEDGTYTDDYGD